MKASADWGEDMGEESEVHVNNGGEGGGDGGSTSGTLLTSPFRRFFLTIFSGATFTACIAYRYRLAVNPG